MRKNALSLLRVTAILVLTSFILPDHSSAESEWQQQTTPTTAFLYSVWGSAVDEVFAVGAAGTILHYDGSDWSSETFNTLNTLYSVWGSSASDVFAVGAVGKILHYDGSDWSLESSGTTEALNSVWGSSASDVFAVGAGGRILHYDGDNWSQTVVGIRTLNGLSGSSANDAFVVGEAGTIAMYNGTDWSLMESVNSAKLQAVWAEFFTDTFAVGENGTVLKLTRTEPDVTIGGSVTGLVGSGLVLQNNGTDDENISGDGPFTFDTPLTPGTTYSVTVATDPINPAQFCNVARGSGTVPAQGVDDVLVTCASHAFLPGAVYLPLLLDD
jgi:hypothetical protein